MTSASERHGLTHYSASSCNLFQAEPALFIMEKLLGIKGNVGCAAHRGNAVEHGVVKVLVEGLPLKEAQDAALKEFDRLSALSADPNREKERGVVADIVEQAVAELAPYGKPTSTQQKIVWSDPSLPLPFVGYIDFYFQDHGILVDLKTQLRLASEISPTHARQVALYAGALGDNVSARVTYATNKKAATYALENPREHVAALVKVAQTMERFLSISDDPKELAKLVLPKTDSFYYSDPQMRQKAFEVYGI